MSDDLERLLRERLQRAELPNAPFSLRLEMQAIAQKPPPPIVRRDRSRAMRLLAIAAVLTVGTLAIVIGSGGGRRAETALEHSPLASSSPTASVAASPSPTPTVSSPTEASPSQPAATPSVVAGGPLVSTAAAPIGLDVMIAPGQDGTVFIAVPAPGGTVVTSLDRSGRPRPGWPITIDRAPSCLVVLAVEDGTVRLVCGGQVVGLGMMSHARAFAFDGAGQMMPGWPVEFPPMSPQGWARYEGRMLGDAVVLSIHTQLEIDWGQVTTISASGEIRDGTDVAFGESVFLWGVGPDGYAYGVGYGPGPSQTSRLTSLDLRGRRSGWPVDVDGVASGPAFGPTGEVVLTVSSPLGETSRVVVLDASGTSIKDSSDELHIQTTTAGDTDCVSPFPKSPAVASDGTSFLFSQIDTKIYALDRSLDVRPGWPYRSTQPLAEIGYDDPQSELSCHFRGEPDVGPDGTLYLPLRARHERVGGSIVAIGPDAEVVAGWPVELTRPGAEFWSVDVGSDGTVYALAIEPEAGGTTSATILAIEPDSTVRYATTIIEP